LEPQENYECTGTHEDVNVYLDDVLGRRGPSENYEFVRIFDTLDDLPASIRGDLFGNPISNNFATRGWHESNLRLPSPAGSPGGYHLHTERENGPVYAHFDAFNGATHTFAHGMEVGSVPIVNPDVTYWTIFDIFANMRTNSPGGPSTIEAIEESASIPSENLETFCGE